MERERQVLVVLPHPDDEAGQSGVLAWHIQNGTTVTYACLTLGEMGRNMGNPPFANRVTLPQIRKQELEASCRAIGIQDLRMLGFHDKTIEFVDQEKLVGKLSGLINELNPSLIHTFYPGYSVHPDHDATGAAVIRAVERMPANRRPVVRCVAFSRGCEEALGPPDVVFDATPFMETKFAAFQAHRSQFHYFFAGKSLQDPEIVARWSKERYWTYKFQ